jgi:hypothetical protein
LSGITLLPRIGVVIGAPCSNPSFSLGQFRISEAWRQARTLLRLSPHDA